MGEKIQRISGKKEKQAGYQKLMAKYEKAVKDGYYAEAEMIVYAFLEDRLRSFMYYLGMINPWNRQWLVDEAAVITGQVSSLNEISTKVEKIDKLIKKAKKPTKELESNELLKAIQNKFSIDQMEDIIKILKKIDEWRDFRNEVTHAWFNKNLDDLNSKFEEHVREGYNIGRMIDNYAGMLKRKAKSNQNLLRSRHWMKRSCCLIV